MSGFNQYNTALLGIFVVITTLVIQGFFAAFIKARQPGAIPGKINDNLSHESLVFRAQRTFMNSMENAPIMIATAFLALFSSANTQWTGILVWVYAAARLIHMFLYYGIATEKNPSPRSRQ